MVKSKKIKELEAKIKLKEDELIKREKDHQMTQEEEKIMRICLERIGQIKADTDRIDYIGKLEGWDKQYMSESIDKFYHGDADLFPPMTFEICETIITYLMSMVYFANPCFKIVGRESRDVDLAENVWYPYMKYQTSVKFDLEDKIEQAFIPFVKYGTVAVRNGWRFKKKNVKMYTGKRDKYEKRIFNRKRKIVWDYPDLQVWPLEDVFFDTQDPDYEEFDFVAFRGRSRLDELMAEDVSKKKSGIYHHVKWLKDENYQATIPMYQVEGAGKKKKDKKSHQQYVEWYECHLYYDLDKDKEAELCVVTIANNKLVIRFQQNPNNGDFIPLLLNQFVRREGSPYGIGVCEILRKPQIELNDTANQTMDNVTKILNNMWMYDTAALDQAAAQVYLKNTQGGTIPLEASVNGLTLDQALKPIITPDIVSVGLEKMKVIREMGKDATAVPSALQGMPSKYRPTATEFQGTQSAAARRLTKAAKSFERKILKKWLERAMLLNYQHVDKEELLRVVGEKAAQYEKKDPSELVMNCDFVPVGSLELENKSEEIQKLLYFLNQVKGIPPQLARVNIPMLLKMIWGSLGDKYKNEEGKIFMEDPQKELIAPEDENVLLQTGSKLAPHIFDNHEQHNIVHSQIEQTENVVKHRQLHNMIAQQMMMQKTGGGGGVGPQELPQPGAGGERVMSKAPGEISGEMKTPPVL